MIPETAYFNYSSKVRLGGQTRNIQCTSVQLREQAPSAIRFGLSREQEDTPGISLNIPLTIAANRNGNAWIFYWDMDHLVNLFSILDGVSNTKAIRMPDEVIGRLKSYRETLTRPFIRGEGFPDKCTRVYRLPLVTPDPTENREIRVLAYHFPDLNRDYLRLNFLRRQVGVLEWNQQPIAEVKNVHKQPALVTDIG
jgi:hypothetical protein